MAKYPSNLRTEPKSSHCLPEPGRPTSSTLHPNSSELISPKLYEVCSQYNRDRREWYYFKLGAGGKPSTFLTAGGL
eukprot:2337458-Pyramimonas_sp.AAC.1